MKLLLYILVFLALTGSAWAATTFEITAGLPAYDKGTPSGDNQFFMTAGMPAADKPSTPTVNGVTEPSAVDGVSNTTNVNGVGL